MLAISDQEFLQLAGYIKANYGIHLKEEKRALVIGRLQQVLLQLGIQTFGEYYNHIVTDRTGKAVSTLIDKITTNHTFFMRESDHFVFFRDRVLPYLSSAVKDKDLRVWSAGCSSGEEPYTIAMILNDYFAKEKLWWDTKVLATDISSQVLEKAVRGQYSNEQIETLPPLWRTNYFRRLNSETLVVDDRLKQEVIFRKFNLMEEFFPFKRRFHAIFCRNVMIYFDHRTKMELVRKFYEMTEPGGYLFIGHSESIDRKETEYKYIMPAIYRKV
jgi:chemotaxis protein methyltransferase CheR